MKHFASTTQKLTALILVAVVALVGVNLSNLTFAASGSLTLTPSASTLNVGDDLVVTVHENSGSDAVVGADVTVNFPASLLTFTGASTTTGPFTVAPPDSATASSVHIVRGAYAGQTGDQVVTVLTFSTKAAGTAAITFSNSTLPLSAGGDITPSIVNGSYTIKTVTTTPPPTTPPTTPTTPAAPTTPSQPATPETKPTKSSSVNISSNGNTSSAITVPDAGTVAVNDPVDVQPTTIQTEGVEKVEYYLDGKIVSTQTEAPYTYKVDTTKLNNGTHDLVSKTYYSNGSVKQTTQHLVVKNAAKKTSTKSITYLLILIIVVAAGFVFIQRRRSHGIVAHGYASVSKDMIVTGDNADWQHGLTKPAAPTTPAHSSTPAAPPVGPKLSGNAPAPGTVIEHNTHPPEDKA